MDSDEMAPGSDVSAFSASDSRPQLLRGRQQLQLLHLRAGNSSKCIRVLQSAQDALASLWPCGRVATTCQPEAESGHFGTSCRGGSVICGAITSCNCLLGRR